MSIFSRSPLPKCSLLAIAAVCWCASSETAFAGPGCEPDPVVLAAKLNSFEDDYLKSSGGEWHQSDLIDQFKALLPTSITPECLAEVVKHLDNGVIEMNGPKKVVVISYKVSTGSFGIGADNKIDLPFAKFNLVLP